MMRAIDADALIVAIEQMMKHQIDADDICEMIQNFPTIEPERKKGKWIPCNNGKFTGGAYWFSCSKCGHIVPGGLQSEKFFCEVCGADMRGEQNEAD